MTEKLKKFGAIRVITEHISESDLCTYFVGFDINPDNGDSEYRWKPFIKLLQGVISEFAFGFHEGVTVLQTEILQKLCEAAKSIRCDGKGGDIGELILHLLLRDFHDTIPLLSKIYFKDNRGIPVHGFDAVHIQPDEKTLWLGESKLYKDGKDGVLALIDDIKKHINGDYLNNEFALISKKVKICPEIPKKDYWINLMHENTKMADVLNSITIPLLCTYTSSNFSNFKEATEEFIVSYEKEVRELKKNFDEKNDHPLKTDLNIILLLFPIKCKDELVEKMNKKITNLRAIDDI